MACSTNDWIHNLATRLPTVTVTPAVVFLCVLSLGAPSPALAQTVTTLYSFTGLSDGGSPAAGLTMDRAGNLYGTTAYGGNSGGAPCYVDGCGTVFKLEHKGSGWVLVSLYAFSGPDGAAPEARVIFGPDGNLYGTTTYGGQ